jgi:hypothetical protein
MGLCLRRRWVGVSLREYVITCLMGLIAAFVSELAVYHSPAEYTCTVAFWHDMQMMLRLLISGIAILNSNLPDFTKNRRSQQDLKHLAR